MIDFLSHILNWLLILPAVGAIVVVLLPNNEVRLARWTAFFMSLPPLIVAIAVFYGVREGTPDLNGYHFADSFEWFPEIGSNWAIGVDGISASMVLLTGLLVPLAILIGWEHTESPKIILALTLMLEMAMFGVFIAQDMLLFFLFYELGLVPMYFMINQWGGKQRKMASMKFFIMTMAFSLGLLLSIQLIAFGVGEKIAHDEATLQVTGGVNPTEEQTEEINRLTDLNARPNFDMVTWTREWPTYSGIYDADDERNEIFGMAAGAIKGFALIGMALAFGLKVPMWPFHTWLPDAHTEAPTAGSMLLAGVLLKQGAYGFIRFVIILFPNELTATRYPRIPGLEELTAFPFTYVGVLAFLGMMGIVLGAFAAWAQDDLKKLVAYSSVNHMGFVVLGLAAMGFVYGMVWAASPQGGDDPVLLLEIIDKDLEDADIATYSAAAGLRIDVDSIDELTASEQRALAEAKLEGIEIGCPVEETHGETEESHGESEAESEATHNEEASSEAETDHNDSAEQTVEGPCIPGVRPDFGRNIHIGTTALNGSVMQMFNHGLSSAAMFLLVGGLYHRAHTRDTRRFGGLWHIIPFFAGVFVFTSMASLGLPGLNGFTGEWLIVSGSFPIFPALTLMSMVGLLLTGAYILKGIRILQGPPNHEWEHYHEHHHSLEIERREVWAIAPLLVLMLVTGIYPNWILTVINTSVESIFAFFAG